MLMWYGWKINAIFLTTVIFLAWWTNRRCNMFGDKKITAASTDAKQPERRFHFLTLSEGLQAFVGLALVWVGLKQLDVGRRQVEISDLQDKIMNAQTSILDKQRIAAERNLPRAWLQVELPDRTKFALRPWNCAPPAVDSLPMQCIRTHQKSSTTRSFDAYVSIGIKNNGTVPAIVDSVSIRLFITRSPEPPISPFDVAGKTVDSVSELQADDTDSWVGNIVGVGVALDPSSEPSIQNAHFHSDAEPDIYRAFTSMPIWVMVDVVYRDYYGVGRKTGYLLKVMGWGPQIVDDPRYTFQD